jgi:Cytochrome c554 and c-prime
MSDTPADDATARGPAPPKARAASRRAAVIGGLGFAAIVGAAAWLIFAANDPSSRTFGSGRTVRLLTIDRPFPPGGRYPSDPYIGPVACRECHPGECALYARSGHARTLSPVARRPLAREVDGKSVPDPGLPGVSWDYHFRNGRLYIERRAPSGIEACVAEYAFGSGGHATTFVNVIDASTPSVLEHRMTYYARDRSFGLTPGHERVPTSAGMNAHGGVPPPRDARSCFECHSTQVSTGPGPGIDEDRLIPNVSCERCHGPGRAHVEAARRGAPESELRVLYGPEHGYTAEQVIALCGMCHRKPGNAVAGPLDPEDTHFARFQPVGILQSRCFRESRGAFSCVTCHDPHARASTDRVIYNTTCLSCHAGAASAPAPSQPAADPHFRPVAGRPCPAEPGGDCVSCHMPRVDAGQGVLFADHWIRVRRREGSRTLR